MPKFGLLCLDGDLEGVKAALARGQDVNGREKFKTTGLMSAIVGEHDSVVQLLLSQPSLDINSSDSYGDTALHCAACMDNVTGLRMLLGDSRQSCRKSRFL